MNYFFRFKRGMPCSPFLRLNDTGLKQIGQIFQEQLFWRKTCPIFSGRVFSGRKRPDRFPAKIVTISDNLE